MATPANAEKAQAMAVLKETLVDNQPRNSYLAQGSGTRLISMLSMTGWSRTARPLSTEQIIQLAAVLICLDVLSQDIAKVTFRMYERLPKNGKREVEAEEHPVAMLLKTEPNRFHTWYEFFEMMLLHLGLVQNAFVAKRMMMDGTTLELIPAMPARVTQYVIEPEDDPYFGMGFLAYRVLRNTPLERLHFAKLPNVFLQDQFLHLRGRMFDGLNGYSNLEAGARTFGMMSELVDYQTRLFASDGKLPGVFEVGNESGDSLSEEAYQRLRDQLSEAVREQTSAAKPLVLEEGMTFKEIAMNAEQAQLRDARDGAIIDVARTFRMPPHKIMQLQNVKYENMETLEKSYVNDTLLPYCKRIEQPMARALLTREERLQYFFEFDRREMLLNEAAKLAEVVKVLVQNGSMSRNEARQFFGFNILEGDAGDSFLIPSTYNLVDGKNVVIIAAGAQPADDGKDAAAEETAKPKKEIQP